MAKKKSRLQKKIIDEAKAKRMRRNRMIKLSIISIAIIIINIICLVPVIQNDMKIIEARDYIYDSNVSGDITMNISVPGHKPSHIFIDGKSYSPNQLTVKIQSLDLSIDQEWTITLEYSSGYRVRRGYHYDIDRFITINTLPTEITYNLSIDSSTTETYKLIIINNYIDLNPGYKIVWIIFIFVFSFQLAITIGYYAISRPKTRRRRKGDQICPYCGNFFVKLDRHRCKHKSKGKLDPEELERLKKAPRRRKRRKKIKVYKDPILHLALSIGWLLWVIYTGIAAWEIYGYTFWP